MSQRVGSDSPQSYNHTTLSALSNMASMACSQEQIGWHHDPAPLAWCHRNRHHYHGYGYDDSVRSYRHPHEDLRPFVARLPHPNTSAIGSIPVTSSLNSSDEPNISYRSSLSRLPRGAAVFVSATFRSGFADDFESDDASDLPE